jgi:hypothetical protein
MDLVANESYIKTRTKIGERAPFVGLIVLVVATVLIFVQPGWMWATMAMVWVGFLISLMGSYLGDRFVGASAHHKRLPEALKGLDSDYTLVMYKLATPFVLVEPGGLTVLTVKSQGGTVTYEDGRWRHRQNLGFLRRFAGQESLGRPDRMLNAEISYVEELLAKEMAEDDAVPVRGVVLFTNPDVELHAEDAPVPALRAAEIKRWLRKERLRPQLSDETMARLAKVLEIPDLAPDDEGA